MIRLSEDVKLVLLALLLIFLTFYLDGCSGKQQGKITEMNELEQEVYSSYTELEPQKFKEQIEAANFKYEAGDYHEAILLYEDVLAEYRTEDKSLEVAINTNMAMAALEMGDRDRFFQNAERARESGRDFSYLPANTQMVFMLEQCFKGDCRNRGDMRVNMAVYDSVRNIFEEGR